MTEIAVPMHAINAILQSIAIAIVGEAGRQAGEIINYNY